MPIVVSGASLAFDVLGGVITMDLSGWGSDGAATGGIIAGVVETEQMVEEFRRAAANFEPSSMCSGPIVDGLANTIRQASDIMLDGWFDPDKLDPATGELPDALKICIRDNGGATFGNLNALSPEGPLLDPAPHDCSHEPVVGIARRGEDDVALVEVDRLFHVLPRERQDAGGGIVVGGDTRSRRVGRQRLGGTIQQVGDGDCERFDARVVYIRQGRVDVGQQHGWSLMWPHCKRKWHWCKNWPILA